MKIKLTDKELDALTYWLEYAECAMEENILCMEETIINDEYNQLKEEKKRYQALLRIMRKVGYAR